MNILIIEDDRYLASKIWEVFQQNILTNRVKCIYSYLEFVEEVPYISSYDIILTDIVLENYNQKTWLDILTCVRKKNTQIPIVIISSRSSYDSLENAFTLWANDYIIKPFRLRELEIRVTKWYHDHIFTQYVSLNREISYKKLIYNISKSEFYIDWSIIPLTRSCKYILSLFIIHAEKILSREFLTEKIWGNTQDISSQNLRVSILRLKEKLEKFNIDTRIHNIRGEGYIFEEN